MILLGIVGTPAAGKSTVATILAEWGAEWINADLIARECLNGPSMITALVERFGESIVDANGQIARQKLADFVFGDEPEHRKALRDLESLVHPETRNVIRKRIVEAAKQRVPVALLDVPLLFESRWDLSCDSIWCVDATADRRLRRAANRGWDSDELTRRERNQLPIETKCRLSNVVMRNDSTLDTLRQNLRREWELLVRINGEGGHHAEPVPPEIAVNLQGHCQSDWAPDIQE